MVDGIGIPPRTVHRTFRRTTSCVVLCPQLRNGGVQLEITRSGTRTQPAHRRNSPANTQKTRLAPGAGIRKWTVRRYARGPLELKIERVIFVRDVPAKMRRVNGVVGLTVFRAHLKVRVDAVCRMNKAVRTCTKVTHQAGTNSVIIRLEPFKNHRAGFSLYRIQWYQSPAFAESLTTGR